MSARTLAAFSTIRTEGAMLPSDILVRVASGDKSLGGLEESSYHLAPGEKIGVSCPCPAASVSPAEFSASFRMR